ncbi:hypothetical protein KUH32_07925 [Thalassococcus sp. CAU 1522]|uniref:HPt domain-containing protein n=1 Tax=Thalassococcus arenae TaxID=2851652 RepID=A0ABS6N7C4_9RHOB|nr:hypothetical protein [Thalassococcus arenae]MBV2359698.1 hypothetical protein [Thalassococcus arenae]
MDPGQLQALCGDLGPHAAEDLICRAMEEMAHRLCQVETLARKGQRVELRKGLRALGAIADQLGMTGVAAVARDVVRCIDDDDPVAEAATLARLARSGESALHALCDLQDLSGL